IRCFHVTGVQTYALPILAQRDGVFERTINRPAVDRDKLERMAVQVHRMILHAHVEQSQPDALSDFDVDRWCVWIAAAVDGPGIRSEERRVGKDDISRGRR